MKAEQLSLELRASAPRLPHDLRPMLARQAAEPFDDTDWLFDPWWDGARVLASVELGRARFIDARGRDLTALFPEAASIASQVEGAPAILDGELVVPDPTGAPDPAALRRRLTGGRRRTTGPSVDPAATLLATDLLYREGRPLLREPLERRRRLLAASLRTGEHVVAISPVEGDGRALHEAACRQRLAGSVAKRKDSPYLPGVRSELWRAVRAAHRFDAVVAGFDPLAGGALRLVLAVYRPRPGGAQELTGVGACTVAPGAAVAAELREALDRRLERFSPLASGPRAGLRWLRPELVATVQHRGWSGGGRLVEPAFVALRDDLDPRTCRFPEPSGTADHGAESKPRRPVLALLQRLPFGEP